MNRPHAHGDIVVSTHGGVHPPMRQEADIKSAVLKQAALSALRHWWIVTFPVGLVLAAAAAAGLYFTFEPQYMARATVEIADQAPFFVFPDVRERSSQRFVKTQQELLRSALVMGPVVSREDVARLPEIAKLEEPVGQLGDKIAFSSRANSNLYDISYTGPDPQNAAVIVNAVVDAYFRLRDEHDAQRMNEIIEQLEREREAHAQKVTRLQNTVRQLTKDNPEAGLRQPLETAVASPLSILRSRVTEQEVAQAMLRAELAALKQLDQANPVEVRDEEVQELVDQSAAVQELTARIAKKRQLLREIMNILVKPQEDPRYKDLTAQIEQDEALLATTKVELEKEVREQVLQQRQFARQEEMDRKQMHLESIGLLQGILQRRLEEELAKKTVDKIDNLELEFKRDELARAETVFDLIAQRIEKLQTEQRAPRQIERRLAATPPKVPVEKYPLKNMALAGMGALCLPLLLAFAWEWRMQRLSNAEQLTAFSSVPVVGEIASFPARAHSTSRVLSRRVSRALRHFEESVHSLRTQLVLSEPLVGMKVLAVTSAISQEGKTSVATQLALSFARANGRVLLIDGDMRSPDVHTIFDLQRGPGLAEVLQGQAALHEAIRRDWSDDIHILPAGRLSSDPHHLLANGAVGRLMDQVRQEYATIIIDTPPVLAASEALVLARAADATLLCTMRDTSRLAQVRTTYKRLVDAGAHPVGAVFSGVPVSRYYHSYGYYEYSSES